MAAQLTVKNLTKTYGKGGRTIKALAAINLLVAKQESVVIIGPNGSGKSTLLKLIAGIEKPTSGIITGSEHASYLPQQPSLLSWRTVEHNLLLPSDVLSIDSAAIKPKARQLLEAFGLLEFASFYPRALSGGMQQKVALLRAVISKPSLMLLDEPFAALDALTRLELQRWLLGLKRQTRASIICVTHDIREAVFLADTIYVLSKRPGQIKHKFSVPAKRAPQADLEAKLYKLLVNKP